MITQASSGNVPTHSPNLPLQDLSNDPRSLPYSDEESNSFLTKDQSQDARDHTSESNQDTKKASFWIAVNIVATVFIVFTNKAIFNDDNLKFIQLSFAAFHFTVTWFVLWALSRDYFAFFTPKQVSIKDMLPLSVAMTLNIIFPNLSLAYSTITFYQIARVLVTPCVAILNYTFYRVSMSGLAASTLIITCLGVSTVSYYDSRPSSDTNVKTTSKIGIVFALTGVFFSSLYTVWIAAFRKKLNISSMQLLLNQAPLSTFLLFCFIPWIDSFPVINDVSASHWVLIPFSGILAMLINISQFFIIAQTGPVASTVVGHSKTCTILVLSWTVSGRAVTDMSVIGLLTALAGIFSYSLIVIRQK